jgi:hypothetical protein
VIKKYKINNANFFNAGRFLENAENKGKINQSQSMAGALICAGELKRRSDFDDERENK